MKLLIVAATAEEVKPFREAAPEAEVLVTGVGLPAVVYELTKKLQSERYDLLVNAGIAGTFRRDWPLGAVVEVVSDRFADLGADDGEAFIDVFGLGLADPDAFPYQGGRLLNPYRTGRFPEAAGITVNAAHGEEGRIAKTLSRLDADTESMEGAGFLYVCLQEGLPCIQLRALSNYVERRQRENWNIPLAVKHLNEHLIALYGELIKND